MIAQPQDEDQGRTRTSSEWESVLESLRRRFPHASDGILFCVYKLQQNPDASLRDFREEAKLHGLSVAGRSLHSAKLLLGLTQPARPWGSNRQPGPARRQRPEAARQRTPAAQGNGDHDGDRDSEEASLEMRVVDAVRKIQESASAQSLRLRQAMQEAIRVLQRALDEV